MDNYNFEDLGEQIREVDRALERECECMMERAGWLNGLKQMVRQMDDVVSENVELREQVERLELEKQDLCRRLEEMCKTSQPTAPVSFYNYGTYNEVLRK